MRQRNDKEENRLADDRDLLVRNGIFEAEEDDKIATVGRGEMTAHIKQKRYMSLLALRFGLALLIPPFGLHAQLNQNCTVSVLNRTAPVDANGNWTINNVPSPYTARARAICVNNGVVQTGQSSLITVHTGVANGFDATITLGSAQPIPASLTITGPAGGLTVGVAAPLAVVATYSGGLTANVSAAATGTTYNISNPAMATITPDGSVTMLSSGTVLIQATNEGAQGLISITSTSALIDSDNDGIPDAVELANGLNPHDPTDALGDLDGDGLTNLEEYRLGTDMRNLANWVT